MTETYRLGKPTAQGQERLTDGAYRRAQHRAALATVGFFVLVALGAMMYGRSPISLRYVALLLGFMIQVVIAFRDIGDLKSSQDEQAVTLPATPHYPGAPGTPTAAQESRQFERDLLCEQVDRKSRRRPS